MVFMQKTKATVFFLYVVEVLLITPHFHLLLCQLGVLWLSNNAIVFNYNQDPVPLNLKMLAHTK